MADLAYTIAGNVLDKLGSLAYQEVSLAWGMKQDLDKLKLITLALQDVLLDAETKQENNPQLKNWLNHLKDVFHEAVDVLDEFECELLRRQVVKQYASFGRKVCRFFSWSNHLVYRFSVVHRVKEIRQQLDEIAKNMETFHLIKTQLNVQQNSLVLENRVMTHSFVNPSDVIGRDREKEEILDMIWMDDHKIENQIPVVSIMGIGGLGKTTLIKSVFNDGKVDEKFDLKIWVSVSLDFNIITLMKDAIMSATNNEAEISKLTNLEQLQRSLSETLKDKKFLLVLDDVWNEDPFKWQEFAELLSVGSKKSKIIVTTRSSKVASIMGGTEPYELKGLPKKDSLSLFFKYAFQGEEDASKYPELKRIGEEIVQKCSGVPLALKTLGSLLRLKTGAHEWKKVRDSKIWELEQEEGRILPALRLSYNAMSPSLRQCFAYCSTFEEDNLMSRLDFICIWMALGILPSPKNKKDPEDIGDSCFVELCNRSLFQVDPDENYFEIFFRVHDLIHNLACSITQNECSIVNSNDDRKISDAVRYLRVVINENNLKKLSKLKKLKSIHVKRTGDEKDEVVQLFLSTCISTFKHLRVFDLLDLSFEVLPNSIGTMKQLRYLNLTCNEKMKRLPDSICKLQSLQTLILGGCVELEEIPKDIGNLVSLRTLWLTTKQSFLAEGGIGRLKSLRLLIIGECKNLRSLPHDLINCTTLRSLSIVVCDQLNLASEFINKDVQLSLHTFVICRLPETTDLPQWLQQSAKTLQKLHIEGCPNLSKLPEWLPKLTSLEKIVIKHCPELLSLPDGMEDLTSLTHLEIEYCNALQEACKQEVGSDWHKIAHIPNRIIGEAD
ncbi:putative disease resistance protein RGA3 [Cannabis sativa]|uniref:putative disease resistance protein RGA3 n=1 Tax=Cannabis sativa TaxID=3483 RepID=UPI0029CA06C8|nr:putative disease resistance protein RGA3 [Cannabis sativa]